jgi:hypothetical protein
MSELEYKQMNMRYPHCTATWTAALSAAIGTGCIVTFLYGENPRSLVRIAAEAAAAIGVVSLLVGLLVVYFLTWMNLAFRSSPAGQGDGAACLHRRREVLNERLNIDEPRLCSQYMIPCTCWSLCGGSGDEDCVSGAMSPGARELLRIRSPRSDANELRVVHRNGMDSCPFRFGSPHARSVSPDGVAPSSSDLGMAPR